MKFGLLIAMLTIVLPSFGAMNTRNNPVQILSKKMDCIFFKVDKELVGARVEVYSYRGEMLLSDVIMQRRTLVDLYFLKPGNYMIRVSNGDTVQSFTYHKKSRSPVMEFKDGEATSGVGQLES